VRDCGTCTNVAQILEKGWYQKGQRNDSDNGSGSGSKSGSMHVTMLKRRQRAALEGRGIEHMCLKNTVFEKFVCFFVVDHIMTTRSGL
jgi:hypothetical protein